MKNATNEMNRRSFLQTSLTALAGLPILGVLLRPALARAEDKLITDLAAGGDTMAEQMIAALGYVNESATDGQSCANCLFYEGGDAATGKCQLIPVPGGVVAKGGWCSSFSVKG